MKIQRHHQLLALLAGLSVAGVAQAHPGHMYGPTWIAGFIHPFTGLDHITAMIAVGLWAAQQGGRARWSLPLAFLAMMATGAALGLSGVSLPGVEPMIAASVLVLGFMISLSSRTPLAVSASLVGVFGMWHGYAHGIEFAGGSMSAAAEFVVGFLSASALLHGVGLLAGGLARRRFDGLVRAGGVAIGAIGVLLLAGL